MDCWKELQTDYFRYVKGLKKKNNKVRLEEAADGM